MFWFRFPCPSPAWVWAASSGCQNPGVREEMVVGQHAMVLAGACLHNLNMWELISVLLSGAHMQAMLAEN